MKSKLFFLLIGCLFLSPLLVFAADKTPFITLVGIPGLTGADITGDNGLNQYINALYRLSISIAALLAVIKIVAAGAKYMLTDIVPAKEEAKKDIQGALIGLLIVIGAIIILNTVNSDLTKVDFNLEETKLDDAVKTGPAGELQKICGNDNTTCTIQVCTDSQNKLPGISEFLPNGSGASCQADCKAAGGFAYKKSADATANIMCAVSNETLSKLMVGKNCTQNESCSVVQCDVYGVKKFSCPSACSDINGVYTSNGQTCLIKNGESKVINCTGGVVGVGGRTGPAIPDMCGSARQSCYDQSGYVSATAGSNITCRIPGVNSPGTANPSPNVLTIKPNQVYKINDPAIPSNNVPAGELDGGIITFKEPLIMFDNKVPATYNGREIKVGCELISPPICP